MRAHIEFQLHCGRVQFNILFEINNKVNAS